MESVTIENVQTSTVVEKTSNFKKLYIENARKENFRRYLYTYIKAIYFFYFIIRFLLHFYKSKHSSKNDFVMTNSLITVEMIALSDKNHLRILNKN